MTEHSEVLRHRRAAELGDLEKVADRAFPVSKEVQHGAASGMPDRAEHAFISEGPAHSES